ncbi:hypothetical protein EON64_13785 [archaeon]|nr:MAG: hypothetical protein EON64_13785 [archaeon]
MLSRSLLHSQTRNQSIQSHRDASNHNKNGTLFGHDSDIIYGGWVNLDEHLTHSFSCVSGSHKPNGTDASIGFARVSAAEQRTYSQKKRVYPIPPGHMVVFNELLVHEVQPAGYSSCLAGFS